MSELFVSADRVVSVQFVYGLASGDREFGWRNTFEVEFGDPVAGEVTRLENLAIALVPFAQGLILDVYSLIRIVISSYTPDGQPYNPNTFIVLNVDQPGLRPCGPGGIMVPLTDTVVTRKEAVAGRNGFMLLRGALRNDELSRQGSVTDIAGPARDAINLVLANMVAAILDLDGQVCMARGVPNVFGTIQSKPVRAWKVTRLGHKGLTNTRQAAAKGFEAGATIVSFLRQVGQTAAEVNNFIELFNELPLGNLPLLPLDSP